MKDIRGKLALKVKSLFEEVQKKIDDKKNKQNKEESVKSTNQKPLVETLPVETPQLDLSQL
jgi:hypothetical protein